MARNITDYFPIEEDDEGAESIPLNPEIGGEYDHFDPLESLGLTRPRQQQAPEPDIREAPPPQGAELPRVPPPRAAPPGQALPTSKAPPPLAATPTAAPARMPAAAQDDSGSALATMAQAGMQAAAGQPQQQFIPPPPQARRREQDNTGNYLAILADFLLGKGRHVGQILGGMQQPDDAQAVEYENWKRNASAAEMNSQIAARNKPAGTSYMQLAAKDRMEHSAQLRDPNSDTSKTVAAEYARQLGRDPKDLVGKVSAEQINMMKSGYINEMNADRMGSNRAAESKEWDRKQGVEYGQWLTKHGIEQDSNESMELFRREQAKAADIDKQGREDARVGDIAEAGFAGFKSTNPDRLALKMRDPKQREEIQKATDKWRTVVDSLKAMEDLRRQYGTEWNSDHAAEFDIYKTSAIGALSQDIGATGTVNAGEFPRYNAMLGQLEPSPLDVMRVGGKDAQLEKIRGARRAFERIANAKLGGEYGLTIDDGTAAPTPTRAPRPQSAPLPSGDPRPPIPKRVTDADLDGF